MIIISSYGFGSPIIEHKYKEYINPHGKSVLIIPFAGYSNNAKAQYEKDALKNYGFDDEKIIICDKTNISEIKDMIFNYIYVPGGDSFSLLFSLKKLNLLEVVREFIKKGSTYIGVSAGAYICTSDIEYVTLLEDNNYKFDDFAALGILEDNIIICHADQYGYKNILKCKELVPYNKHFLYINNTDVVVIDK